MFDNLVEIHLVAVTCNLGLSASVVCFIPKAGNTGSRGIYFYQQQSNKICLVHNIFLNDECNTFQWQKRAAKETNFGSKGFAKFEPLFWAVESTRFPPLFVKQDKFVEVTRHLSVLTRKTVKIMDNNTFAFAIATRNPQSFLPGLNIFTCSDGTMLSPLFACDGFEDCPHDTDENQCKNMSEGPTSFVWANVTATKCGALFNSRRNKFCEVFKSESAGKFEDSSENRHSTLMFNCSNGTQIPWEWANDLVADCLVGNEDEARLMSLVENSSAVVCEHSYQIPCREGHPKCFNVSQICLFLLNSAGHLVPCRTGEHLQNCSVFQCNMMFKCLRSYCIPWNYVCDGMWDCPDGFDEPQLCSHLRQCEQLFKCKHSQICIHFGQVCNQRIDCPGRDDEHFCDLKAVMCPRNCLCLTYALDCQNTGVNQHWLGMTTSFRAAKILNSSFESDVIFWGWERIVVWKSGLRSICPLLTESASLHILDVMSNKISILAPNCFQSATMIRSIDISENLIKHISRNVFINLTCLSYLNLSSNPVADIKPGAFAHLPNLFLLSLLNLGQATFPNNILNLKLKVLQVDDSGFAALPNNSAH